MSKGSASDEIYQLLRKEILSLRFIPGQELNINSLAAQLECSRSPVRDAIMRLNSDNLVDIFPQKGTRVSLISLSRVEEERFLRRSLEEPALTKFAEIATESDIAKLEAAVEAQIEAFAKNDYPAFFEADDAFHCVSFQAIDKSWCWNLIATQSGTYHRIRLLSFSLNAVIDNIISQHKAIIKALKNRDEKGVLALIHQHLGKLDSEIEILLSEYSNYFVSEKNKSIKPL